MTARRVTVVGGGVLGLGVAAELAAGGDSVTVVADRWADETVSAVAAAVWFPYRSGSPSLPTWLARSVARFAELATDGETGVDLREDATATAVRGVTLSWGCAEAVAALAAGVSAES